MQYDATRHGAQQRQSSAVKSHKTECGMAQRSIAWVTRDRYLRKTRELANAIVDVQFAAEASPRSRSQALLNPALQLPATRTSMLVCICVCLYMPLSLYIYIYIYREREIIKSSYRYVGQDITKQLSHNTGAFRARHSAFVNRRLVTTFYGCSIVAEQEHVRKSRISRVKHPMLRLSQNDTT